METLKKLIQFLKDVANDERIPSSDKKILIVLIGLVISPLDIIPDWIPIIGVLDDIVILAIIFDYLFEILDTNVLLDHYPFGMKSFHWTKRAASIITGLTPKWVRDRIWSYKGDIYKN
ncbi:MAG: DUF1232 domain-containing protein [Bdellovibrionales bacterium]